MEYLTRHQNIVSTPQSQPIPGEDQIVNAAGGFVWEIDRWARLHRFLVLGSEGGTYYASEQSLTQENCTGALECIKEDGQRVVELVVEISEAGRAPKNDPALFVLALASVKGDLPTRQAAFKALPRVARIGTHLFHFCTFRQSLGGGWGRGMQGAVARWYNDKEPGNLAYQLIKYRQRDGWTQRDVLRKAHPVPQSLGHDELFRWAIHGGDIENKLVQAYEEAQTADVGRLCQLIEAYSLPREAIPTDKLNQQRVWVSLLQDMPIGALVRNLGKMGSIGLLVPLASTVQYVSQKLGDADKIARSRIHPIQILAALNTYSQGHGFRGSLEWPVVSNIVDALNDAFYLAFDNVEPAGKRTLLGLDVSGSMDVGYIAGVGGISPRVGTAAMAMVTVRSEPQTHAIAFSHITQEFPLSATQRLDDVVRAMSCLIFGGTNCALPMFYALDNDLEVDTFVVYTDNETWAGRRGHPSQALVEYRRASGIPAKLIIVAMTATECSTADPNDAGMLDIVGFDTATPNVISQFSGA